MAYLEDNLEPDEIIVSQASVHWLPYALSFTALVAVMAIGWYSGLASTKLALTNRRMFGKVGFFMRKRLDLKHKDIAIVNVQQSPLGRACDYGTLVIGGIDGSRIKFRGIANIIDLQLQINDAVETATLGRKLSDDIAMIAAVDIDAAPPNDKFPVIELPKTPAVTPPPAEKKKEEEKDGTEVEEPTTTPPPPAPTTPPPIHQDPNVW